MLSDAVNLPVAMIHAGLSSGLVSSSTNEVLMLVKLPLPMGHLRCRKMQPPESAYRIKISSASQKAAFTY